MVKVCEVGKCAKLRVLVDRAARGDARRRGYGEAQVVIAQEAREKGIGRVDVRGAGQAQLLDQTIL